jgi:CARDB
MRRLALLSLLAAAALAPPAQAKPPVLAARLTACAIGATAEERSAAFTGSMPAVQGSRRMAIRFDLRERIPPSAGFTAVRVPGLGVWHRSRPGRAGLVFTQRVEGLAAPGSYRAVVRFRWYDARGTVVRSARRTTRTCREPDARPDLRVADVAARHGPGPDTARYRLAVLNEGLGDADAFDVVVTPNGAPQPAERVDGLGAGDLATVTVIGPRCAAGSTLRVVVDARAEIAERDEADDVTDVACPFDS